MHSVSQRSLLKPTKICSDQLKKKYDLLKDFKGAHRIFGWVNEWGLEAMDF